MGAQAVIERTPASAQDQIEAAKKPNAERRILRSARRVCEIVTVLICALTQSCTVFLCLVLKEAARARAQYARACELRGKVVLPVHVHVQTIVGWPPDASASAPIPQDWSQRPGGGGQALLLLALGVAGGHGGQTADAHVGSISSV